MQAQISFLTTDHLANRTFTQLDSQQNERCIVIIQMEEPKSKLVLLDAGHPHGTYLLSFLCDFPARLI